MPLSFRVKTCCDLRVNLAQAPASSIKFFLSSSFLEDKASDHGDTDGLLLFRVFFLFVFPCRVTLCAVSVAVAADDVRLSSAAACLIPGRN